MEKITKEPQKIGTPVTYSAPMYRAASVIIETIRHLITEGGTVTEEIIIEKAERCCLEVATPEESDSRRELIRMVLHNIGALRIEKDGKTMRMRELWEPETHSENVVRKTLMSELREYVKAHPDFWKNNLL